MVEQGTHKPLVTGSNPVAAIPLMAWVYVLKGLNGRHYIGSTVDLEARLKQHERGHTHSTKCLGGALQIVARREYATLKEGSRQRKIRN